MINMIYKENTRINSDKENVMINLVTGQGRTGKKGTWCSMDMVVIYAVMLYSSKGFPSIPCLSLHSSMKAEPQAGIPLVCVFFFYFKCSILSAPNVLPSSCL